VIFPKSIVLYLRTQYYFLSETSWLAPVGRSPLPQGLFANGLVFALVGFFAHCAGNLRQSRRNAAPSPTLHLGFVIRF
jgi:hypothetical protein